MQKGIEAKNKRSFALIFKKLLLVTAITLVILPGCDSLKYHQTTCRELKQSVLYDSAKNARGRCSKSVRTQDNYLKPAALKRIFIGMSQNEVIDRIGRAHKKLGLNNDHNNRPCETFEYYLDRPDYSEAIFCTIFSLGLLFPTLFFPDRNIETYRLFFYNNKLTQCNKVKRGGETTSRPPNSLGNTSFGGTQSASSGISSTSISSYPTGYGQVSKTTGRVRNNIVSGYHRRNGTYVKPYARS